jgi:hypothetical protein
MMTTGNLILMKLKLLDFYINSKASVSMLSKIKAAKEA